MPLHRPGSANVAASVCIYRKRERPLRCRPIVWPCPTACLCSPVPAVQSAFVSPHRVPSLCFDVRHRAGDRTFYAPIRPRRRPIVQWRLTQGRGGPAIPLPAIQGPVGHCASPAAPPRPFCDVLVAPLLAMSIIRRRQVQPVIAPSLPAPPLPAIQLPSRR